MGKGLVILHLDGVGHAFLDRALHAGRMPAVARLIEEESYRSLEYRCGIPSTTPFCQAGILYGDNREIPSYRWWDKETGLLVAFGHGSSFEKVADRYFQGAEPLTRGGAVIGSCYPAGAKDTFGLAYHEPRYAGSEESHSALRILVPFFASPARVGDWLRHGAWAVGRTTAATLGDLVHGRPAAAPYVVSDMLGEIFLHHVARYAVKQAMDRDFATIYAGFYAYDETAHGFGPEDPYCLDMLRHVDRTIADIAAHRTGRRGTPSEYELVILSDHGQVESLPFGAGDGRTLGELLAARLPGYDVTEYKGGRHGPQREPVEGRIALTYSGGLAHLYFTDRPGRLGADEVDRLQPGLADAIASLERIAFVLLRDRFGGALLVHGGDRLPLGDAAAREFLSAYDDDPALLARQLERLNTFERSGDMVIFGGYRNGREFNFEHQVGGHGSIGGEQVKPFLLVKEEWGIDTGRVEGAADLHPILSGLRDRLAAAG
ncbi:MAG TPA: alkaline phosphatase family protein [Candidatus Dormibacteraeota bacterium]|nr:alkaline phosphatase family protein [Candidatus Dormibacteraeota bacterium]